MKLAHGDVILNQVESIPTEAQPKEDSVLQEGEHTGHAHRLSATTETETQPYQIYEQDGNLWVDIKETTALRHEEHKEIMLAPGFYRVGIVREFDPFEEIIREVTD